MSDSKKEVILLTTNESTRIIGIRIDDENLKTYIYDLIVQYIKRYYKDKNITIEQIYINICIENIPNINELKYKLVNLIKYDNHCKDYLYTLHDDENKVYIHKFVYDF